MFSVDKAHSNLKFTDDHICGPESHNLPVARGHKTIFIISFGKKQDEMITITDNLVRSTDFLIRISDSSTSLLIFIVG